MKRRSFGSGWIVMTVLTMLLFGTATEISGARFHRAGHLTNVPHVQKTTVVPAPVPGSRLVIAATVQSSPMDGSQIDQVGDQVMNSNEFRSV